MRRLPSLVAALALSLGSAARGSVEYRLELAPRAAHQVIVEMTVHAAPSPLELAMPVWTPGAYELRTWGRNVTPLDAAVPSTGAALRFVRSGPSSFTVSGHAAGADVRVRYRVYAALISDDASQLDAGHAYLNGTSIFLEARGAERGLHQVSAALPSGWRAASALDETPAGWEAPSYEALVDAPIELGRFVSADVAAAGRSYRIAVDGASEVPAQLERDLAAIVEAEVKLVGAPPYRRYLVLIHFADGLGRVAALEHAASTSIVVTHRALAPGPEYDELLYMIAHELFHAWNARRLRPAELVPYDFSRPRPARSLWITEGLTEYYAHRALRLSGRWTRKRYLDRLGDEATRAATAARRGLTVEEEAELTWQPPDESAQDPDAYYARGHLAALALDARLRSVSGGKHSLDDVVRALLKDAERAGGVLPVDGDVLDRAVAAVEPALAGEVAALTRAPDETDRVSTALTQLGLRLAVEEAPPRTVAGFSAEPDGETLRVAAVSPSGPAARAGLRPGDRIVLFDGAPPGSKWAAQVQAKSPGAALLVEAVRATRRILLELHVETLRPIGCRVAEAPATPKVTTLRDAWLGR